MGTTARTARKRPVLFIVFAAVSVAATVVGLLRPGLVPLYYHDAAAGAQREPGMSLPTLLAVVAGLLALSELAMLITQLVFARRRKPAVESIMVARLYRLVALLAVGLSIAAGFGALKTIGAFFAMFGGMLLGWSLQAPVSGFAAYLLVSLKRPFRPGDRIQFPNLGLTGDVHTTGPMYTILDQVGGAIGSEEAVGRHILVPNPLLFSQVVINYTVLQEAAYMLDEVVVRITYDSDWEAAEGLLLRAAREITADIIQTTGVAPYIRSDLYDYGVYLRLRFQTHVKDRVEIQYKIVKQIFLEIQQTPAVDLAIPFVYSYRAGMDKRDEGPREREDKELRDIREIAVESIQPSQPLPDDNEVKQIAQSIAAHGLLQPIVLVPKLNESCYDILAGHLRFAACRHLGWKTVPAVVRVADKPLTDGSAPKMWPNSDQRLEL